MKRIILTLIACSLVAACNTNPSGTNSSKEPEKNKEITEKNRFNEPDKPSREAVAIQRLKDIRTLQEAHKNVKGYHASTMDSLKMFYNEGLKETLFLDRTDFCVDSLAYIPFSGGDTVIMNSVVIEISGVKIPLFEAKMPYASLLKGLDDQYVSKIISSRENQGLYPGLMIGDVKRPNNNVGNWE